MENINKNLLPQLKYNQWKNTNKYYTLVQQHQRKAELQVYTEFYPSIWEETLNRAINFAENYTLIYQENIRIIKLQKVLIILQ